MKKIYYTKGVTNDFENTDEAKQKDCKIGRNTMANDDYSGVVRTIFCA